MLHKISKIGLFVIVPLYIFHFLFFWVFESTDSFFYWAFANFIKTGTYVSVYPYNYAVPSTMEPPLYSLILFFLQFFPRADVLVHLIQVAAILGAGAMIYSIMGSFAALIFLLVPGHFIYMSNLVAEPIAVFLITFYMYLLHKIISEKKTHLISWLLVFSALMVLQRYNLIVFYGFAVYFYYLQFMPQPLRSAMTFLRTSQALPIKSGSRTVGVLKKHDLPASATSVTRIFLVISLSILLGWIFINNRLNGSWGLSNSEGKHLYNRIMHFDRLLPPSDNPDFVKFKQIVGGDKDYFLPWWYYEPALMSHLGSEKASSDLMGKVAWAALWTNPLKYLINNFSFFVFAHGSNPTYHDALYLWNGSMSRNCRSLGTIEFCRPVIKSNAVLAVWDNMVGKIDYFYLNVSPYINYLLLFPAIIYAFWQKNKLFRAYAFLYLVSVMLFIFVEAPLPRYTYVFTPLQVMLISYLICGSCSYILRRI